MYKFRLSIGDWSGDGHGLHEEFTISSNAPVENVREAHFAIKDTIGVDIENICSSYEDYEIDEDVVDTVKCLGFDFENSPGTSCVETSVRDMARLWIFLLQKADPSQKLEIVDEDIPTLHFYGYDEKGRHIGFVGYGIF